MKKIIISFLILCSITVWNFVFSDSNELDNKLKIIADKMDLIIEDKWEDYRIKIIDTLELMKIKYKNKQSHEFIINYFIEHLNISHSIWDNSPNILLIIADDMWLDASPWYSDYKWLKPKTPNLDILADNGLVFDNVWSNPLCSPTRSTILTGKYGIHTWVLWALWKADDWVSISEYSLQKFISEKAPEKYNQAVIWKWHLATDNNGWNNNPELMWIPYYSGYISGTLKDYYSWRKTTNGSSKLSNTYATTDFTDESIEWVNDNNTKPWFLWLAYTAPHTPFHLAPKELLSPETYNNLSWEQSDINENPLDYYLASIEAMDTEIGRLLDNLEPEEAENTIIIFIGDNWTPSQVTQTPFKSWESKGSIFRWGIHVPMIISWKWVDNGRSQEYINTSDLYTTIAELTGISLAEYENSISFKNTIYWEDREVNRDYLYAEIASPNKNWWASVKNGWTIRSQWYQFISLDNWTEKLFADSDIAQKNNLIKDYPEVADILREKWNIVRWDASEYSYGSYPHDENDIVCSDLNENINNSL